MVELNKVAGLEIAKLCCSEDLAFRVRSRRNKLLGLWAATHLGKADDEADAYAREVVAVGVLSLNDAPIVDRIRHDFDAHGVDVPDGTVHGEMARFNTIAILEHGSAPPGHRVAA